MNIFLIPKIIDSLKIEDILILNSKNVKKENSENENSENFAHENNEKIIISKTLHKYITNIKSQIDNYIDKWDLYKKYTNPYEYIHTIVPDKKTSVSKYKPLSRSFYKFIEICNTFNILPDNDVTINSFHLAEGPGGFIEAIIHLHENSNDKYIGMTLQSINLDIPGWKKSQDFLKRYDNIYLENGPKKNGDLFEIDNLEYCYKKYKNTIDIVTGDGGFDFSINFDNQEEQSSKLIFAQILYALCIQKTNGTFIIKFFDTFTKISLDMLYILSSYYKTVNIIKPNTSRMANSEKYLVCEGYKNNDYIIVEYFIKNYKQIINDNNRFDSILKISIPYYFINKIEDYNAILGQQQIENINTTINRIINKDTNDENIKELININVAKCINWCNRHNIPISNIFI